MIQGYFPILPFPLYYSELMKKHTAPPKQNRGAVTKSTAKGAITREYVHSLRGKLRGKGLLKALMAEKKTER